MTETTKTEKTEQTKTEEQVVGTRPLTNVAITGSTPTVTETTKTETMTETENDGA